MAVPSLALTWEQGDDLTMTILYKEGPSGQEQPVNLSGGAYQCRMDIRTGDTQRTLLYTFNSDDIVELPSVDAVGSADNEAVLTADGYINIKVPRAISLPGGPVANYVSATNTATLVYDVFIRKMATNTQTKILQGTITINRSVTLWS